MRQLRAGAWGVERARRASGKTPPPPETVSATMQLIQKCPRGILNPSGSQMNLHCPLA